LSSRMFVITKIKFLMKKILLIHYTFHCVSARILLYQKVKRLSSPYSLHILVSIWLARIFSRCCWLTMEWFT
jgi:hypothetical protein